MRRTIKAVCADNLPDRHILDAFFRQVVAELLAERIARLQRLAACTVPASGVAPTLNTVP